MIPLNKAMNPSVSASRRPRVMVSVGLVDLRNKTCAGGLGMGRFCMLLGTLCSACWLVSCSTQSETSEISKVLAQLPATTTECFVARSLNDISHLSAGYGDALARELIEWLLLPAAPERTEGYSKRGIATDRPFVVARISGDPGPEQERTLVILPIFDIVTARAAALEHIRVVSSVIDSSDVIVARSPYYEDDLGAITFINNRWLVIGLEESGDKPARPEQVLAEYGVEHAVSLADWMKLSELQAALPADWCIFIYQRREGGMRVLSMNRASRGEAVIYAYEKKWLEAIS